MVVRATEGRGAADTGGAEEGAGARDVAEGCDGVQRAVRRGKAGPDRHALVREVRGRSAMGGVPADVPAFPGAAGADVAAGYPAQSFVRDEPRWYSAGSGQLAVAGAVAREARTAGEPSPAREDA